MDNLVVKKYDAVKLRTECHLNDNVEKDPKNRMTENYITVWC